MTTLSAYSIVSFVYFCVRNISWYLIPDCGFSERKYDNYSNCSVVNSSYSVSVF